MTQVAPRKGHTNTDGAPSYKAAAIVSAIVLALYLVTLAPTIGLWDAGEYVAAAAGLGIPHPPGNPGFVLLGRVVSLTPIASTVAGRLNVLVAIASALSAGLWFLVTEQVARNWFSRTPALAIAAAAAIVGATAFTVWNQSVVNEKVYTVSLFLLSLDLWATLRWQAAPDGRHADRRLALLSYRLGLGYTIHIAGLLAGPALLAAVLYTRPRTFLRARLLMMCAAMFVLGVSPYIALPIRAAFRLEINEGHPTACQDGAPHWDCTVSRETLDRFLYENNRTQYAKPSLLDRQESLSNQVRMWWLYFKWQWFRDPSGASPDWQGSLAVVMLLLTALGGYTHWRRDRRTFVPFATLILTLTAGLIYYLNFKLGYSQAVAMGVQDPRAHEVRDRDYFYLWSYSALSVWIALGIAYVWQRLAEFLADDGADDARATPTPAQWRMTAPVLAVALIPLVLNWSAASRRGETFAEDFAVDVLNSVEPNGILFTGGDNDSFPLWFAQQVLGVRRDVTVVLLAYLSTDWYVREQINRELVQYDPATGPAIYKTLPRTPTIPVLAMSPAAADSIPLITRTTAPSRIQLAGFDVDIPAGTPLTRDVVVMLRIIRDAGGTRPIYFSSGAGSAPIDRFLSDRLVTQGLARKLVAHPDSAPGVVRNGTEHVDLERSIAMWKTFSGPAAIERQGRWIDAPSANTPYLYMRLGYAITTALAQAPRGAEQLGFIAAGRAAPSSSLQANTDLRHQLGRMSASLNYMRLISGRQQVLEAPSGLGYAPVTGR